MFKKFHFDLSIIFDATSEELRYQGSIYSTMTIQQAKTVWKKADAVCFDVDSTVIMDEGIDELAAFCGKGKEVSQW